MRSPAPNQAESEFDDLLGQLTDELAMTPASQSAVALVPDLEPPKVHVESTSRMAAEAAAAAGVLHPTASKPDTTIVKIVAILAGSLTVVSIAALVVFGQMKPVVEDPAVVEDAAVAQSERNADEAAERRAEQEAYDRAMQAERAADQAEFARIEAAHLTAQLAPKAESKPKPPKKPKPKKPKPEIGDDFGEL
jgi:hypothetical protein